ncbi:MAG: MBL fold metallo-hydrolase, partial [Chloroflexota bacterium]
MKVKWLGHSCFLITSQGGTKILTDPYEANYRDILKY